MLYHEVTDVISAMRNLEVGLFEHLYITSVMDGYIRVQYTQHIQEGPELKKYQQVIAEFKDQANLLAGDHWSLGQAKGGYMEQLWTWSKVDAIGGSEDPIRGSQRCTYSDKKSWFKLGKSMWSKHG